MKRNYHNLPTLQKAIVLCLAGYGAQTRNEVKDKLGKAYKNILFSFVSLEKKELIKIVGYKKHKGQKFPQYWITPIAVIVALFNDADIQKTKKNALKFCKDDERKSLEIVFELFEDVEPVVAKLMYRIMLQKGETNLSDLIIYSLNELRGLEEDQIFKALFSISKKYPRHWRKYTEPKIEEMWRKLGRLLKHEGTKE